MRLYDGTKKLSCLDIYFITQDDTVLNFDPETGFIDMPGGMHKFDIHRDPVTGLYLTLNNNNTDPSRPAQRNTLSLIGSEDLRNWYHIRTVLQDNSGYTWRGSMLNVGFQYVVWEADGDDLTLACTFINRPSAIRAHPAAVCGVNQPGVYVKAVIQHRSSC